MYLFRPGKGRNVFVPTRKDLDKKRSGGTTLGAGVVNCGRVCANFSVTFESREQILSLLVLARNQGVDHQGGVQT